MGMLVKLIGTFVFKEEIGSDTKFYVSPMFVTMFELEGKKWDKNAMIAVVITQREFDKDFITPGMIQPTANWSEMKLETYQGEEMYSITYTPKKEKDVRVSHKKSIEIEAESLEEAREQLKSQIPEGLQLLSERVISDGKPKTVKAVADTTEAAFAKAQSKIPDSVNVLERKELTAPERQVITVEAADEQGAKSNAKFRARSRFGSTAIVESLQLTVAGRKGFLGIGAKLNQYEAEILQQAAVEITYKTKAKISAELGKEAEKVLSSGYCQMCGKSNSPSEVSEKSIHFFCSPGCKERYFKQKASSILFGPETFHVGLPSPMVDSGRKAAQSLTVHCWSCGRAIPMSADKCTSCGKEQKIKRED